MQSVVDLLNHYFEHKDYTHLLDLTLAYHMRQNKLDIITIKDSRILVSIAPDKVDIFTNNASGIGQELFLKDIKPLCNSLQLILIQVNDFVKCIDPICDNLTDFYTFNDKERYADFQERLCRHLGLNFIEFKLIDD